MQGRKLFSPFSNHCSFTTEQWEDLAVNRFSVINLSIANGNTGRHYTLPIVVQNMVHNIR